MLQTVKDGKNNQKTVGQLLHYKGHWKKCHCHVITLNDSYIIWNRDSDLLFYWIHAERGNALSAAMTDTALKKQTTK